jgi:formylglycine-generating enzyme required for sulfatase activity
MRVRSRSRRLLAAAPAIAIAAAACGCEAALKLDGLEGGCPPLRGSAQVKVTSSSGTPYCIDATEATNAQYTQFLASGFTLSAASTPQGCTAGDSNTPVADWPPAPGLDAFPVTNVTWCQATAFCRWAGKRLCGAIGGGALAVVSLTDTKVSQWLSACTNRGAQAFPYGNTFQATACSDTTLSIVASYPACVGGFPGIFDMNGNVWEWTDTCASADPQAFCHAMGGAFDSNPSELTCASERSWTRSSGARNIGFRCCLDL